LLPHREAPPPPPERPARAALPGTGYVLPSPAQRPVGSLRIRGVVLEDGVPAAGVRVIATRPEAGQTLSELTCAEVLGQPGLKDDPVRCWTETSRLKLELLQARQGEAFIQAGTVTPPNGTFTLEGLPEGRFTLWALGPRGVGLWPEAEAGADGLELVLRDGLTLEGRVTGEDGLPVAGVRVTALYSEHTRFFDAETGADGRYRLGPLPFAPSYEVAFVKEGWQSELYWTSQGQHEDVRLLRPRHVQGRVLKGGEPVADAEVRLVDPLEHALTRTVSRTDAQGRFRFEGRPPREHFLAASHGGHHALLKVEPAPPGSPAVVLELGSALMVEGTVRGAGGAPVAGARVRVDAWEDLPPNRKATTDEEGRYRLGPLPPGEYPFSVTAPRHADGSGEKRRVGPDTGAVDFTLEPVPSIEGVAVDAEGRPLPGVELELRNPREDARVQREFGPNVEAGAEDTGRTDEEGRFRVDASQPGTYVLEVMPERGFLVERLEVQAPAMGLRWVLSRGASVSGTVTDERGAPMHPATVTVWRADEEGYSEASGGTDARGRFLLSGLPPGRYVVEATYAAGVVERSGAQRIELEADASKDVTVRLEDGWTLSGQVVDEAGQPVAGVRIVPDTPDEAQPEWRRSVGFISCSGPPSLRTGPEGRFTLRNLPGAELDLDAVKEGYRLLPARSSGGEPSKRERLRVRADTGEVRLVLGRLARIRGRLTGPDGAPVPAFTVNGTLGIDPGGAFAEPFEDSGPQHLAFTAPGMAVVHRMVETRAGMDLDMGEVRLTPGRRLSGQVLDARTSEPVKDAQAYASGARRPAGAPFRYEGLLRMGSEGRFESPRVEDGPITLSVTASGYLTHRQELGAGDLEGLTVRLTPGDSDLE
ncbi:MAG TPA: carboxypeptidase regulatory-like domain-containing protein, partial [Myxococcus sp.]|nr:carboxypeptidase regulatory-like domain-containing protein [Myxococcus sp.]